MMQFYICEHCGNIVTFVKSSGVPVMCCGQKMTELIPGTTDAAVEKHVPVVQSEGAQVTVTVGSVEHPMLSPSTSSSGSPWRPRRASRSSI